MKTERQIADDSARRNSLIVDPKTRRLMQIWELSPAQLRAHKRKLLWLIVKTRVRRLAFVLRARVHNLVYSSRRWIALVLFEALLVPAVIRAARGGGKRGAKGAAAVARARAQPPAVGALERGEATNLAPGQRQHHFHRAPSAQK